MILVAAPANDTEHQREVQQQRRQITLVSDKELTKSWAVLHRSTTTTAKTTRGKSDSLSPLKFLGFRTAAKETPDGCQGERAAGVGETGLMTGYSTDPATLGWGYSLSLPLPLFSI